eukprot:1188041-Prorocentrum_minimum.AAC.1
MVQTIPRRPRNLQRVTVRVILNVVDHRLGGRVGHVRDRPGDQHDQLVADVSIVLGERRGKHERREHDFVDVALVALQRSGDTGTIERRRHAVGGGRDILQLHGRGVVEQNIVIDSAGKTVGVAELRQFEVVVRVGNQTGNGVRRVPSGVKRRVRRRSTSALVHEVFQEEEVRSRQRGVQVERVCDQRHGRSSPPRVRDVPRNRERVLAGHHVAVLQMAGLVGGEHVPAGRGVLVLDHHGGVAEIVDRAVEVQRHRAAQRVRVRQSDRSALLEMQFEVERVRALVVVEHERPQGQVPGVRAGVQQRTRRVGEARADVHGGVGGHRHRARRRRVERDVASGCGVREVRQPERVRRVSVDAGVEGHGTLRRDLRPGPVRERLGLHESPGRGFVKVQGKGGKPEALHGHGVVRVHHVGALERHGKRDRGDGGGVRGTCHRIGAAGGLFREHKVGGVQILQLEAVRREEVHEARRDDDQVAAVAEGVEVGHADRGFAGGRARDHARVRHKQVVRFEPQNVLMRVEVDPREGERRRVRGVAGGERPCGCGQLICEHLVAFGGDQSLRSILRVELKPQRLILVHHSA